MATSLSKAKEPSVRRWWEHANADGVVPVSTVNDQLSASDLAGVSRELSPTLDRFSRVCPSRLPGRIAA